MLLSPPHQTPVHVHIRRDRLGGQNRVRSGPGGVFRRRQAPAAPQLPPALVEAVLRHDGGRATPFVKLQRGRGLLVLGALAFQHVGGLGLLLDVFLFFVFLCLLVTSWLLGGSRGCSSGGADTAVRRRRSTRGLGFVALGCYCR